MSDVERLTGSPESAMLMSDISELIFSHANMVGIDIVLNEPWGIDDIKLLNTVVLAGMIAKRDGKFVNEIEVWHLSDPSDGPVVDIFFGDEDEGCTVTNDGAIDLMSGKRLSEDEVGVVRFWLGQTHWSKARSQAAVERG